MRWSKEMEEEFIDLKIIENILQEKRTVKGDFDTEIYIKEKKVDFSKVSILNGEIEIDLPKDKIKNEHLGKKFVYPRNMGVYEQYAALSEQMWFTVENAGKIVCEHEKDDSKIWTLYDWKNYTLDDIENENEGTIVKEVTDLSIESKQVYCLMAKGYIGESLKQYVGYIYIILYGRYAYRLYIMSEYKDWKTTYKLGEMIVRNMEIKVGKK